MRRRYEPCVKHIRHRTTSTRPGERHHRAFGKVRKHFVPALRVTLRGVYRVSPTKQHAAHQRDFTSARHLYGEAPVHENALECAFIDAPLSREDKPTRRRSRAPRRKCAHQNVPLVTLARRAHENTQFNFETHECRPFHERATQNMSVSKGSNRRVVPTVAFTFHLKPPQLLEFAFARLQRASHCAIMRVYFISLVCSRARARVDAREHDVPLNRRRRLSLPRARRRLVAHREHIPELALSSVDALF
mmetsp:Transcript_6083/g.21957  ORF Transcript_6083/g.21957 Transcript_6083/m.21957 type:complete len:247 (+) Transcript_6083:202-942(+)